MLSYFACAIFSLVALFGVISFGLVIGPFGFLASLALVVCGFCVGARAGRDDTIDALRSSDRSGRGDNVRDDAGASGG